MNTFNDDISLAEVMTANEARALQKQGGSRSLIQFVNELDAKIKEVCINPNSNRSWVSANIEALNEDTRNKLINFWSDLGYECYLAQGMTSEVINIKWGKQ